jgi:hypothetical protein
MALQRPTRTGGGDYLDLKAATIDGPLLVVFKIVEFLPMEMDDYNKPSYPVRADALVCSGSDKGRVYLGGTFKFAITNALRGAGREEPEPTTKVGDELVIRCEQAKKKGVPSGTVFGNIPSDAEVEAAEAVHQDGKGWEAAEVPAQRGEPAMAGAGAAKKSKPWD